MKLKEGAKRRANREDEAIKGSKERWQREKMRLKEGSKENGKQRRQTAAYNDTGVLSVFFYLSSMVSPP